MKEQDQIYNYHPGLKSGFIFAKNIQYFPNPSTLVRTSSGVVISNTFNVL